MKRDLYVCKETYKETCRHDLDRKSSCFLAEVTYLVEKNPVNETYMYEKRPVHMKKMYKETCMYAKRPTKRPSEMIWVARALVFWQK